MGDQGVEFSLFQGNHVKIDIRIDISVSIRPMTRKFGKHLHLVEVTQVRLIPDFGVSVAILNTEDTP